MVQLIQETHSFSCGHLSPKYNRAGWNISELSLLILNYLHIQSSWHLRVHTHISSRQSSKRRKFEVRLSLKTILFVRDSLSLWPTGSQYSLLSSRNTWHISSHGLPCHLSAPRKKLIKVLWVGREAYNDHRVVWTTNSTILIDETRIANQTSFLTYRTQKICFSLGMEWRL